MDSERQSDGQSGSAESVSRFSPCYQAYKISAGKWGIVYRISARESFDQRVTYPTKRRAVAIAALLNREDSR